MKPSAKPRSAERLLQPVPPGFSVRIDQGPLRIDEAAIDAAWLNLQARSGGHLFDAPMLAYSSTYSGGVLARIVSYRHYATGAVEALSVSGLTWLTNRLVVGRRSPSVSTCAGMLELVPSGAIEPGRLVAAGHFDYAAQALQEFEEETGIPRSRATSCTAFGLYHDKANRVYDICVEIRLDMNEDEFRAALRPSHEYESIGLLDLSEACRLAMDSPHKLVPTTAAILNTLRPATPT